MRQQQTPQAPRQPPDVPADKDISVALTKYLRDFALWCREGFAAQMKNNEAHQGVLLRASDAPAGTNPKTWMLQVNTAGVLNLSPMTLGLSDAPGTSVPVARTGVTDGSSAPAGQIGEFVAASASNVPLTNSAYVNIASITLTPGDWDVVGRLYIIPTAGSTNFQGGFTTTSNGTSQDVVQAGGTSSFYAVAVPARRFSVTVSTVVYLVGFCVFSSGTAGGHGSLQARRMR